MKVGLNGLALKGDIFEGYRRKWLAHLGFSVSCAEPTEAQPRPRPAAGIFSLSENVLWPSGGGFDTQFCLQIAGVAPAEAKASAELQVSPERAPPRRPFGPPRRRVSCKHDGCLALPFFVG